MPLKRDDMPSALIRLAEQVQRAYLDARATVTRNGAADASASASPSASESKAKSKAALLEEAKAAGIAGRTKMSKEQLVEALEKARQS
jgi:hypothetical protein